MKQTKVNIWLILVAAICASVSPVYQQADNGELVYLCIEPSSDAQPYLIGMKTVDLVGFVPSENASVTLYSPADQSVLVGVYTILPDAASGGYRRDTKVGTALTTSQLPADRPCSAGYSEQLSDMWMTFTIPMSPDFAMLIERSVTLSQAPFTEPLHLDDNLDTLPFLGAMGIYLSPPASPADASTTDAASGYGFQLIQLSAAAIDLTFPFVQDDRSIMVLSNKDVTLSLTSAESAGTDEDFSGGRAPINYQSANDRMQRSQYGFTGSLFQVMEDNYFRIYPHGITLEAYLATSFIRLELGPSEVTRNPAFIADQGSGSQQVLPLNLPDIRADYFLPTRRDEPIGQLVPSSAGISVVGIDAQGQLIVQGSNQSNVIIEAWYVEVAP